jgi:hypothetical protein
MKPSPPAKQLLGPRHLVGAGILVVGVAGLAKLFIALGHSQAARAVSPQQARAANTRGQYGSQP